MSKESRKHIRFHADENTFVVAQINKNNLGGLCITESRGGCSAVFINHKDFIAGTKCYLKVGKLGTLEAEIRWVTEMDTDIVKVGFEYLE